MGNFQEKVTFIWDLADLLRGVYKRNEYQKIILPFTVLKRFDSVLSDSKKKVLEAYNKYKKEFENIEHVLQDAATDKKGNQLGFYNYSKYDFKTLLEDPDHIEQNLVWRGKPTAFKLWMRAPQSFSTLNDYETMS